MFKEFETTQENSLAPSEALRRAKVQYYLERAEEESLCARYSAALRSLKNTLKLDGGNLRANELEQEVLNRLGQITGDPAAGGAAYQGGIATRRSSVIMIADQDPRVLSGLSWTLQHYGFPTIGAGSFEEAVEAVTSCVPRVVLSEVNFESGSRGLDLFEAVRQIRSAHDVVFIFMALRVERELEIAGHRLGVDGFVLKPFDNEVVAATILSCLSRH